MTINVKLVSWTENPIETMMWSFMNMHWKIPDNLDDFVKEQKEKFGEEGWEELKKDFLKLMSENPHSSVLEFVNTVWYIDGASRAFQQQLTRTRTAAYSIQSLRIVPVGSFAKDNNYHIPERIANNKEALKEYEEFMGVCEKYYEKISKIEGIKTEDARGILPLNINSPITMAINLRAMQHMMEWRMCYLTQGEFRDVAKLMRDEIKEKLGKEFLQLFQPPCVKLGTCPMVINCEKMGFPHKPVYKNLNIERWIKG